ncbi:MAG TPA: hypothetical protein VMH39_08505, partial [Gemmatimonadaceae bacterium]|nr:hypothetical protein [Gemmatimonadaceae bacterium]
MSASVLLAQAASSDNPLEIQLKPDRSLIATDAPAAGSSAQVLKGAIAGRWDLTLRDAHGKEMPSWLQIIETPETC